MLSKTLMVAFILLSAVSAVGGSSADRTTSRPFVETGSGEDIGDDGTTPTQSVETAGSAKVTITETGTGAPVSGATVRIGDRAAVTGADGSCSFTGVPSGHTSVSVTKPGYQPSAGNIALVKDTTVSKDLAVARLGGSATYDVLIVGAGTGGVSAAIQAARMGMRVALLEDSDWIGGQMTAAGVTSLDEGHFLPANRSGIYREFVDLVKQYYAARGKSTGTAYYTPTSIAFEPSVGQKILYRMLSGGGAASGPTLDLYLRARVTKTVSSGNAVTGVVLGDGTSIGSRVTIDASEYGDLLPLTSARYRAGNSTSDAIDTFARLNPITWTAVIKKYLSGMDQQLLIPSPPAGYQDALGILSSWVTLDGTGADLWFQGGKIDNTIPVSFAFQNSWRGMPDSANPADYDASAGLYREITRSGINSGHNDYPVTVGYLEDPAYRKQVNCSAKLKTLQALYYFQDELGLKDWSVAADEGYDTPGNTENACLDLPPGYAAIERHFPVIPYVRESRRAIGIMTLTAKDTKRDGVTALKNFPSSLAVGDYPYDIHGGVSAVDLDCGDRTEDIVKSWGQAGGAFQVPFETFIPETVDGLLMAEKNLSASRLVSSAIRLQPITMMTGQAAGALAAVAVQQGVQPRQVKPVDVQWKLLKSGCILSLDNPSDVPISHPYWKQIQLALLYKIADYGGVNFDLNGTMRRSDLAALLNNAFGVFPEVDNPDAPATRADFAVLLASAMKLNLVDAPLATEYDDVPSNHHALRDGQLLHELGGFNGPFSGSRFFQPDSVITRGEISFFTINAALRSGNSSLHNIILQRNDPRGVTGSVTINGGAEATGAPAVTLTLTALADGNPVTSMQLRKDGTDWYPWEPFSATRTVTLTGGDGVKNVYVRFSDSAGNISQAYSDAIILNTTPPTGSIVIDGGAQSTGLTTVTLTLSASGSVSPVTSMQFSKDGKNWYGWEPFATTRSAKLANGAGVNTIYVRFRDSSGNVSPACSDSIVLIP